MKKAPMPVVVPLEYNFVCTGFFMKLWEWITYKRQWKLVEDYIFFCPVSKCMMRVPKNFVLDFASIPFFLRWIPGLAKTGVLLRNSVPHDFLYRHGFLFYPDSDERYILEGQKIADRIFREYGILSTGAVITNNLAYALLRVFGRFNYKPKPYVPDT